MNRRMRTYYYAVFGAIGGLIGWQISNLMGLSFTANIYFSESIVGALVGLSIGLLIGIAEGVLTRNPIQAGRSGLFSGLLGLVAGAIGLPLGEWMFQAVGAGILGRAVGWGVFVTVGVGVCAWAAEVQDVIATSTRASPAARGNARNRDILFFMLISFSTNPQQEDPFSVRARLRRLLLRGYSNLLWEIDVAFVKGFG